MHELAHGDVEWLLDRERNRTGHGVGGHGDPTLNSATEITPPAP